MSQNDSRSLHDLPPSAKLVYKVLKHETKLTQRQLIEQTRLPERTVRYGLNELEELGIVREEIYFVDARKRLYSLDSPPEGEIRNNE